MNPHRSLGAVFLRIATLSPLVLGLLLLVVLPAWADVQGAYQREFAFLEAEKHSLNQRLAALENEGASKTAEARAEVDRLQGRVLALDLQAEQLTEKITDVEQEVDTTSEDADLVDGILQQAAVLLEKGNVELPERDEKDEQGADATQLRFAFLNGVHMLNTSAAVRKEKGDFFAVNGEKVSGTVIHLGRIASYGVSDSAAGALAPAGGDELKMWPDTDSAGIARALAGGEAPALLRLFLYESLDNGVDRKEKESVQQHIESGGFIGWVIVALGALALLLVLVRVYLLWSAAANTSKLVEQCTPLVAEKRFDDALALCSKARSAGGRVLSATIKHIHRDRVEIEDVVSEAVLHETPTLDRFGSMITVIAAVAPLLGLLGTVTGMIATFDIITEYGTGNPKMLSSGIAIALITTELGLVVAIPTLILGNLLASWSGSIKDGMDKAALRIVNVATGVRLSAQPPNQPPPSERKLSGTEGEPAISGA